MPLTPGTRLSPYEILSAIGAGGMGEVYRARDTTLGRQVAIKVLPEAFAQDAERLARFEREAKTRASLHHPLGRDVDARGPDGVVRGGRGPGSYDVSRDGTKFLMLRRCGSRTGPGEPGAQRVRRLEAPCADEVTIRPAES